VPGGIDAEAYELFAHPCLPHLRAHYPSRCHATYGVPLTCQLMFCGRARQLTLLLYTRGRIFIPQNLKYVLLQFLEVLWRIVIRHV
jgi:hypothetical protein